MTQEIKLKLEQATAHYDTSDYDACNHKSGFLAGAKTILENPEEWGLMPILDSMDHIEESDQNWSEAVDDLKSQLTKLQSELEFYKRRADHDPNSPFNKLVNAVDKKLAQLLGEQKKDGKKFISDEEVDQLIDKIVREELGNDTGRS